MKMQTEIKKTYHENGRLMSKQMFLNGKRHGKQNSFYPDGTKATEWFMINGNDHGLEQYWLLNKTRRSLDQLKKNQQDGTSIFFYY